MTSEVLLFIGGACTGIVCLVLACLFSLKRPK